MNTLLLFIFILGIGCFLLTGLLVVVSTTSEDKNFMPYKRAKGMVIISLIMIVPYIVLVGF